MTEAEIAHRLEICYNTAPHLRGPIEMARNLISNIASIIDDDVNYDAIERFDDAIIVIAESLAKKNIKCPYTLKSLGFLRDAIGKLYKLSTKNVKFIALHTKLDRNREDCLLESSRCILEGFILIISFIF